MAIGSLTLVKSTGTGAGTDTDITGKVIALFNEDSAVADSTTAPLSVPSTSGSAAVYSYESWLKWKLTTLPDNYIQNVGIYGANTQPGTGMTIYMGTTSTGVTPVNTISPVASGESARQDTNYNSPGTALILSEQPVDGKLDTINDETYWVVLQLKVDYGASSGDTGAIFNLTYQEV